MSGEVLHMKQRYLYDVCGKMSQLAHQDAANRAAYDDLYPDVFCRFSEKNTRQRMRRRPKAQKPATDAGAFARPVPRAEVLLDLNGSARAAPQRAPPAGDVALLTTRLGQRWIVRRAHLGGELMRLTYCDGSSSLLMEPEARALGVTFSAAE
jgi:hypothetical protein